MQIFEEISKLKYILEPVEHVGAKLRRFFIVPIYYTLRILLQVNHCNPKRNVYKQCLVKTIEMPWKYFDGFIVFTIANKNYRL